MNLRETLGDFSHHHGRGEVREVLSRLPLHLAVFLARRRDLTGGHISCTLTDREEAQKMRILIAYDGSDCADRAINDLRRAGLPPEAEAVVISVADVLLPVPPPSSDELVEAAFSNNVPAVTKNARERALRAVSEARELALAGTERLKAHFPSWQVRAEAYGDSPAWAVIKEAEDQPNSPCRSARSDDDNRR